MPGLAHFHTPDEAEAALAAAEQDRASVTLATTPGAAGFAGPSYLKSAVDRAQAGHPDAQATAWIDCGEDAALVLRAIKAGWHHVIYTGSKASAERVADICAQQGVEIRTVRPKLDGTGGRDQR